MTMIKTSSVATGGARGALPPYLDQGCSQDSCKTGEKVWMVGGGGGGGGAHT